MKKYYCSECEKVIDEEEVDTWKEPSEAWGQIVYEEFLVCPFCGEPVGEYYGEIEDDGEF